LIRLENIFISLENNKNLIRDINIFIPSGSMISIVGGSGSGKTKLLKIMGLEEKASKGKLFILGKNINKLSRSELAKLHTEISIVNEKNDLLENFGVKENIIFPLIVTKKKSKEIEIALNELVSWLNIGKILEKNIYTLSRTEEKLVQFARAIIIRPRMLLLDNFFSGMNYELVKKIFYLLVALKKIGTTTISFGSEVNNDVINFSTKYKIQNSTIVML